MTMLEWIALGILLGVWLTSWVLWALTSKAEELVRLIRFLPENLVEAWEEQRRRRRQHSELRRKADRTGSLTKEEWNQLVTYDCEEFSGDAGTGEPMSWDEWLEQDRKELSRR